MLSPLHPHTLLRLFRPVGVRWGCCCWGGFWPTFCLLFTESMRSLRIHGLPSGVVEPTNGDEKSCSWRSFSSLTDATPGADVLDDEPLDHLAVRSRSKPDRGSGRFLLVFEERHRCERTPPAAAGPRAPCRLRGTAPPGMAAVAAVPRRCSRRRWPALVPPTRRESRTGRPGDRGPPCSPYSADAFIGVDQNPLVRQFVFVGFFLHPVDAVGRSRVGIRLPSRIRFH